MEILLVVDRGDDTRGAEVVVTLDGRATVADLASALGGGPGSTLSVRRTSSELDPGSAVEETDLLSGDEVGVVAATQSEERGGAVNKPVLTVLTGPRRGERIVISEVSTVGRDDSAGITVADPLMSRVHARFVPAEDGGLSVEDAGSSNGTAVDGSNINGTTGLVTGAVVTCGTTQFEVRLGGRARAAAVRRSEATVGFSRPPRVVPEPIEFRQPFPGPPVEVQARKIPVIATIAPVVMAAIMSVFVGPVMLVFALISPIMMLANRWEDSRSGRKAYDKELELFLAESGRAAASANDAHARVEARRRESQPDAREVLARVDALSPLLWERRSEDADSLTLRVGTADQPTLLEIAGGPSEDDERDFAVSMRAQMDGLRMDRGAPFSVDLLRTPVAGVVGNPSAVTDTLRWLVAQAATQCSPNDLAVVVVSPGSTEWNWARWLPHARTLRTDSPHGRTVGSSEQDARGLLAAVESLVGDREVHRSRRAGQETLSDILPRVLLVVPDGRTVSEATLTGILTRGAGLGVSALIGSGRVDEALGVVGTVVDVVESSVTDVRTGQKTTGVTMEGLDENRALRLARALSPVRDTTQRSAAGEIPQSVLLLDLLGMPDPRPEDLVSAWESTTGSARLDAPVGVGPAGPVSLDLRVHGPHGLVAGTTGSGKSELLQSLVVSLASRHSPRRLNFVLIDYKGGAAFKDCVDLPHTVGFFTDLDAHLAVRALVSLNAELKRREHILGEHGAKDIIELEESNPSAAPANLLIVFDEFAFLKRQVPEFVAGVIDIAQRGRSLGVHLVLATQRPSGVIDENIRANTNLRIALRVADQGDSEDVIDRADAVSIPKSIPGRAFVKTGPSDIRAVQTAYANARRDSGDLGGGDVTVMGFDEAMSPVRGTRSAAARAVSEGPTDLQRLAAAIRGAAERLALPAQPVPWLDPLPATVELPAVPVDGPETSVQLGTVDLPEQQVQAPFAYDPVRDGHMVVFGASGAGKTTVVRTLLAQMCRSLPPADLTVYALDFASRALGPLADLPHCGGVIASDEQERIDRLFAHLDRTVAARKRLLGEWGVSSVAEARAAGHRVPYVAVAIDGFASFYSTYQVVDHGDLVDRFLKLLSDGRTTGVFFVVTGDRRNAVPSSVSSLISSRLVMRMGEPDEYVSLGLPGDLGRTEVVPGRAFTSTRHEVQVGVFGDDPSGGAQAARIREIAGAMGVADPSLVCIDPLPDTVPLASLKAGGQDVPFAVHGESGDTVALDLLDSPVFAVFGPERSGRTTALSTIVTGVVSRSPGARLFLAAPRRTALVDGFPWEQVGRGTDGVDTMLVELAAEIRERGVDSSDTIVVVIDGGEEMTEGPAASAMGDIIRRARDAGVVVIAAVATSAAHRSFGGWVSDLKRQRHAIVLCPEVDVDGDLFGVRFPRKASRRFPAGRGYLVRRGSVDYCHVAS